MSVLCCDAPQIGYLSANSPAITMSTTPINHRWCFMDQTVPMSDEGQSSALALLRRQIDALVDAGRTRVIESLMTTCPRLRTDDELLLECVLAEYRARDAHGHAPQIEEYLQRFPQQTDRLQLLFAGRVPRREIPSIHGQAVPPPTLKASIQTIQSASTQPTPLERAADVPLGKTFGRYVIERELGKGAMGVVYLAEDTQLRRKVALKVPCRASLDQSDALARFYREARTAGTLHHTNICPVYDVGQIGDTHYLTMGYISGKPLLSLLESERRLTAGQIAVLIRKIALALDYAHQLGIVHRDLKPSNVMIDGRGEPIVMDFGLACQVNTAEQARLTQSGALLGTPAYMSPEQVRGELNLIGPPTDIYALGVVLYQLLTGQLPFDGPVSMILVQVLSHEPPPPWEICPDVDRTLAAICLKMMDKDIALRFAGMKDVANALTDYLETRGADQLEWNLASATSTAAVVGTEPDAEIPTSLKAKSKPEKASHRSRPHQFESSEARQIAERMRRRSWLAMGGLGLFMLVTAVFILWMLLRRAP